MSFSICYSPDHAAAAAAATNASPLTLTGLVGRDGQVYWLEPDAAKLFGTTITPVVHHRSLPKVSDVTGFIPHHHLHRLHQQPQRYHRRKRHYYRDWFLNKRVLSHDQLCQAFQNTTTDEDGARIRRFGALLNDPDTHVTVETHPVNKNPLLRIHHNKPAIPTSSIPEVETFLKDHHHDPIPFFVWLGCFKFQIHEALYRS